MCVWFFYIRTLGSREGALKNNSDPTLVSDECYLLCWMVSALKITSVIMLHCKHVKGFPVANSRVAQDAAFVYDLL